MEGTMEDANDKEKTAQTDQEMGQEEGQAGADQEMEELIEENMPSLAPQQQPVSVRSLEFILDIPLHVSVVLGRTKMLINDLLQLGQGSVIELTKIAGEPMEVLVNNKLIARGEVVVVNEKYGIRLTDIISPVERIEKLK